jgi:hypothetical protein
MMHESEEDIYVAPPPPPMSRRQMRRAERRSSPPSLSHMHFDLDHADDELDLDVALGNSWLT